MTARLPNRRIRLLLVFFVLAFLATFGRAVWLQAVQAQPLDRMARGQHDVDRRRPRRAGLDPRPKRRRAGDRKAGDHRLREPASCRRPARDGGRGRPGARHRRREAVREARRPLAGLRLPRAQGGPQARGGAEGPRPDRARLLSGGAAGLPAGRRRLARARLRRPRQPRPLRARARPRSDARRPERKADGCARPVRPDDRRALGGARLSRARTCG